MVANHTKIPKTKSTTIMGAREKDIYKRNELE